MVRFHIAQAPNILPVFIILSCRDITHAQLATCCGMPMLRMLCCPHHFLVSNEKVRMHCLALVNSYISTHLNQSPLCLSIQQVLLLKMTLFKVLNDLEQGASNFCLSSNLPFVTLLIFCRKSKRFSFRQGRGLFLITL